MSTKSRRNKRQRLREQQLKACDEQGKVAYADITEARDAAGRVFQARSYVLYPYRCPCGSWHLTKNKPSGKKNSTGGQQV